MKGSRRGGDAPRRFVMRGVLVGLAASALLIGMPATQTQAKGHDVSFVINAGSVYTNTVDVTLTLQAASVNLVRYKNAGGTFTAWEPYVVRRAWVLAPGDGLKTVEAVYRTTSGAIRTVSAPITLDTTAPVTTAPDAPEDWQRGPVTGHLNASDALSGVAGTWYRVDGGPWTAGTTFTLCTWRRGGNSGVHLVEYYSADAAGNVEAVKHSEVMLDARAPVTTDDAPRATASAPVSVHLTATDAHSGVATTWYRIDEASWTEGSSLVVEGPGLHWISYYSVDKAGNVENRHWRSVMITALP